MKFRKVTEKEFFATVGQLDVHPSPEKTETTWKLRDGRVVGLSRPGYMEPNRDKEYFIIARGE